MVRSSVNRIRVALFGSYYRGFFVLNELLNGPLKDRLTVVGVATDDPTANFVSVGKRVWRYGYSNDERELVKSLAASAGLRAYDARVKTEAFYRLYEDVWQPDLCLMATFGQRIDERLFTYPRFGFINLHPSDDDEWPSRYAGPDPFSEMLKDDCANCVITLHRVDNGFDTGERLLVSDTIPIPSGASVIDMHKISAPFAAAGVRTLLENAPWLAGELIAN